MDVCGGSGTVSATADRRRLPYHSDSRALRSHGAVANRDARMRDLVDALRQPVSCAATRSPWVLTPMTCHFGRLEDESIEIVREAVACSANPVMLYSIGKDSSVMLRLAQKAFWPAQLPFPLLHIDTTWKFRAMIAFRDETARALGVKLLVHTNREALADGIDPFVDGSERYTDLMKTVALKQALDLWGFDLAFGGARRDEEKARAKERIFSFRARGHRRDPKLQRPELWNLYNARSNSGETVRVFPLSNWTEADVWSYIREERIRVVPLYFAAPRPVVRRNGRWIMVDDDRMKISEDERPETRLVRFRTLGCYPLTAAIESDATTLDDVIKEVLAARFSERQGRVIDFDGGGSMERKKVEGYF
jgi:sulfate adenylyltransferase subunit 2